MVKDKQRRVSAKFADNLDRIKLERIKLGIDKKFISDARLTDGIIKDPNFRDMSRRLMKLPRKEQLDKKRLGSLLDPITLIVVTFLAVLFFAGLIYGFSLLNDKLQDIDYAPSENVNTTIIAQDTFGKVNSSMAGLRLVATAIIFSLVLSIFLGNFLIKTHPAWVFAYIGVVMLAVILSVPVANSFEIIQDLAPFGGNIQTFTIGSFILGNLPIFVAVVGIFGAIFLFINIQRDEGLGGGVGGI